MQVELVDVEYDPWEVAEKEGEGNASEDGEEAAVVAGLQAVLLVVAEDLDVEEHDESEGEGDRRQKSAKEKGHEGCLRN